MMRQAQVVVRSCLLLHLEVGRQIRPAVRACGLVGRERFFGVGCGC